MFYTSARFAFYVRTFCPSCTYLLPFMYVLVCANVGTYFTITFLPFSI